MRSQSTENQSNQYYKQELSLKSEKENTIFYNYCRTHNLNREYPKWFRWRLFLNQIINAEILYTLSRSLKTILLTCMQRTVKLKCFGSALFLPFFKIFFISCNNKRIDSTLRQKEEFQGPYRCSISTNDTIYLLSERFYSRRQTEVIHCSKQNRNLGIKTEPVLERSGCNAWYRGYVWFLCRIQYTEY